MADQDSPDAELLAQARAIVIQHQRGSISLVQRHLGVGSTRADKLLEQLERDGVVGPINAEGGRAVRIQSSGEPHRQVQRRAPKQAAAVDALLANAAMRGPDAGEVLAWQHEEDPAHVISGIQKAQALRDGGASASSVKLYSVPLRFAELIRTAGVETGGGCSNG